MAGSRVRAARWTFVAGLMLALASAFTPWARAGELERGRDLAQTMCGACHAIGDDGDSANAEAPPFRVIAERYSVWNLQEALAEGILVGHPDMPQFTLEPDEINALLSYMETLGPDAPAQ